MSEMDQLPAVVEKEEQAIERVEVVEAIGPGDASGLPARQQAALELLAGGMSVAETARQVGVGRATLFRWLKDDPHFRAAHHEWHEQMKTSCQSRLLSLTGKAADAVEKALDAGNARLALQLLKGMGILKERPAGPTEPGEIMARDEIEKEQRRLSLKRDRAKLMMSELEAEMGI